MVRSRSCVGGKGCGEGGRDGEKVKGGGGSHGGQSQKVKTPIPEQGDGSEQERKGGIGIAGRQAIAAGGIEEAGITAGIISIKKKR